MEPKSSVTRLGVWLAVVAILIAGYGLVKTKPEAATVSDDSLTNIQQSKQMDVCYAVWEPAVIKNATTGKLSGHDIDAMEVMAKEIGATITYHESTFGNMAAAVQSGQCDIGTSLFVKISRSAAVAFSRPIFYAGNSGLVKKGDTRFKTITDVDKAGMTVAVANGESGHIYAKDHFKNAKIIVIDVDSADLSRFMLEVTAGRADIAIADANQIANFAKAHPETTDVFAGNTFDLNPDAFPMRHGDVNFHNFINNSLLYMETSGKWAELEKKYDAHWLHDMPDFQMS